MSRREVLGGILRDILGSTNVYFQPPSTVKLKYPCIIYSINKTNEKRADNKLYLFTQGYSIKYIDSDPDSDTPAKILSLPMCSFDRRYTSDNLNHDVYNIYF